MTTNDRLTVNHTNPNHPTWIGFGFDPALVLPHERSRFQQEALSILKSLRHHCPFVIKDPRLAYVGECVLHGWHTEKQCMPCDDAANRMHT